MSSGLQYFCLPRSRRPPRCSGNLFVENILEAAACIGSKGGHIGEAAADEVPKYWEELIEGGDACLR